MSTIVKGTQEQEMVEVYYTLYDRMLDYQRLKRGFQRVKAADGAPGIDGQTIADFEQDLHSNLTTLLKELREKAYCPLPVRESEIPKLTGGSRKLGIPAVRDRVVQQALLSILQPIYDPEFHPSSYAYRPKKSQHQAIAKAALFIRRYEMGLFDMAAVQTGIPVLLPEGIKVDMSRIRGP